MDDERIYEVERQTPDGWKFVGNLTVKDWGIRNAFQDRALEEDFEDGTYRLLHWQDEFASGSYYLLELTSERRRVVEMRPARGAELETS